MCHAGEMHLELSGKLVYVFRQPDWPSKAHCALSALRTDIDIRVWSLQD